MQQIAGLDEEFLYLMQSAFINYKLERCKEALYFCEEIITSNLEEYYIASAQEMYDEIQEKCN